MEPVPSVTREYIETRGFLHPDVNLSIIRSLSDFRSRFSILNSISHFFGTENPTESAQVVLKAQHRELREFRKNNGYFVQRFDLEAMYTPEELCRISEVMSKKVDKVNILVDAINSIGVDDVDILVIGAIWTEMNSVISEPVDGYSFSW